MSWTTFSVSGVRRTGVLSAKLGLAMVACSVMLLVAPRAKADIVNSDIGVSGTFSTSISGGGTATLNGATGNYRQWILFGHTNIGINAGAQNVGLSVPTVNPGPLNASGNVNMDYDDVTPGTPSVINSVVADLNGSTNIPLTINVAPIAITVGSLLPLNLNLTANLTITDFDFVSNGSSAVLGGNGGSYDVPGDFVVTLQGSVTGVTSGLLSINLGTIYSLPSTEVVIPGNLLGNVTTTDLDGGNPPFPNDMLANYFATLPTIEVPLDLPFDVSVNQTIPNGQSGLQTLNASGIINALVYLNNPSYNVSGTVNQVLQEVPEPTSGVLALLAMAGGALARRRR